MRLAVIIAIGLALVGGPAAAQASQPSPRAEASITIERSLAVSALRPMSFGRTTADRATATAGDAGEAVIRVSGDPRRLYRVTLPESISAQPGDLPVETFAIVSDNAGDITRTLTGRTDAQGVDHLRIRGRLRQTTGIVLKDVTAAIPVGVDYE